MELSQYIIDTISSVDQSVAGHHHHHNIAIQLKAAAATAPAQEDSHLLETIGGVISMSYVLKEHQFKPLAVWRDGQRSFAFEDLTDNDAVLMEMVANTVQNVSIRAKLYHVVWLLSNNYQHGETAVSEYIALFEETFDPSHWVDCHEAIQCAFYIASKLGKNTGVLKKTKTAIHQKIIMMDGKDPLFLSLLLLELVINDAAGKELLNSITLGYACKYLKEFGEFPINDLDFLVSDNIIVPENRAEIIKEGLHLGLTGKLYASMHILLPQTENIFRNLVRLCGDTTTFLKEDGTESYKPLSALFRSERLRECYNENIIFTFQSIMDEPIGENLRNLNAHGALEPQIGNSSSALYFLCLVIKLLVMYSPQAQPILRALAAKDSSQEKQDT